MTARAAQISILIQAGGKSSRMGQDKALMPFQKMTLLEYILAQVEGLGADIGLITNSPRDYRRFGLPLYSDLIPDWGALGGLYTALHYSPRQHCLLLACDMPFINRPLLEHMLGLAPKHDAVIPRLNPKFAEPFRAIYSRACLPAVRAAIDRGERRVISFFEQVDIHFLERADIEVFDPRLRTFFNINTPADLLEAERLAGEIQA